jgi:alginate O-acetyltransferase complex protein AlgI
MSYTIDVYLRNVKTQRNPFKLALYISLFPQLIAGPIVRYIDVEKELTSRTYDIDKIFKGVVRFSVGLAKKVVISNTVGMLADNIFKLDPTLMSSATGWLGAIAYTLQIYFDFSGYSDMAIGLGHMMGFNFIENFNYPYISKSVQEFWRRWHISLSSWFRDYLYIPLGGNRKGKVRTYINLLIVFACTGFWHGAAWNFLAWGMFHGLFQIIERLGLKKVLAADFKSLENKPKLAKALRIVMSVVGHIYTLLVAIIGWVMFRAETMTKAWQYICTMFRFSDWGWVKAVAQLDGYTLVIILLGIVCSLPIVPFVREKIRKYKWSETAYSVIGAVAMVTLLLLSIFCLTGSDYNPFIYFRF